jgi:dTDP-4-dehydrorhamnose 3,5-epimerase
MIEGVLIHPLRQILDERGKIMHMLRASDPHFVGFGEIYFSVVYPGVIKGWHLHKRMVLNYAVPCGRIKFVLYDAREGSSSRGELQELYLGEDAYSLVQVPPGVWNGFKGIGTAPAIVANCSSIEHDPEEILRLDPLGNDVIPYDWALKNR